MENKTENARMARWCWVESKIDQLRMLLREHGFSIASVSNSYQVKLTIGTKDGVIELVDNYDDFPSNNLLAQIALLVG